MKHYTVDFTRVETLEELHIALKEGFGLPCSYEMSMDSLWDFLTGGLVKDNSIVYIKGLRTVPPELCGKIELLLEVLEETVKWFSHAGVEFGFREVKRNGFYV